MARQPGLGEWIDDPHMKGHRRGLLSLTVATAVLLSTVVGSIVFTGTVAAAAAGNIAAAPTDPGVNATHKVSIDVTDNEAGNSLSNIYVNYSVDPQYNGSTKWVNLSNVKRVGIDMDEDGDIDRNVTDMKAVRHPHNGTLTFDFTGDYSLYENESVIVVYNETVNPEPAGNYTVEMDINTGAKFDPVNATLRVGENVTWFTNETTTYETRYEPAADHDELIDSAPPRPNQQATHHAVIPTSSNEVGNSLSNVRVNYHADGSFDGSVQDVDLNDVKKIGFDVDGDGDIETSTMDDLKEVDSDNVGETITFNLGGNYGIKDDYTVIVVYSDVTNPTSPGNYTVEADINTQSTANPRTGSLKLANFTHSPNVTLTNVSTVNSTFNGTNVSYTNLTNVTWNRTNFTNVSVNHSVWTNVTWYGSNVTNATFNYTNLTNVLVNYTNVTNVTLNRTNVTNVTLNRTNVTNVTVVNATLRNVTLRNVTYLNSTLNRTNVTNVTVYRTNLTNVTWYRTNVTNATFLASNLTNVTWNATTVANVTFNVSEFANVTWNDTNVTDTVFNYTVAENVTLSNVTISNATFNDSIVTNVTLSNVSVANSTFNETNLSNSSLTNTSVTNVTWNVSDFHNISTTNVSWTNVTWTDINMTEVAVSNATWDGVNATDLSRVNATYNGTHAMNDTFTDYHVRNSTYENVTTANSTFTDVKVYNSTVVDVTFENVTLTDVKLVNVTLTGVTIENEDIEDGKITDDTIETEDEFVKKAEDGGGGDGPTGLSNGQ